MDDIDRPVFKGESPPFPPFDRVALVRLIKMVLRPRCRMAEIGCWLGTGSTQVFIENLSALGGTLFCIDTWRGSPNVAEHQRMIAEYDVFRTFMLNADSPVVKPIRARSADAAKTFDDRSLDLVFIDGDHCYAEVMQDIAAWRPKLRSGGILCGHDCEIRVGKENADLLKLHREADTIESPDTRFLQLHPGSILAVHEMFAGRAKLFSDEEFRLETGARGYSCVWWTKSP